MAAPGEAPCPLAWSDGGYLGDDSGGRHDTRSRSPASPPALCAPPRTDGATHQSDDGHLVVGTPAYLSPEAHGGERANPTFDLWALSVAFYELITGCRPFEGDTRDELAAAIREGKRAPISTHVASCPPEVERFFAEALANDPSARPRTAQHLAKRLGELRRRAVTCAAK